MSRIIRIFLASSIIEFEDERIAIGAFVERLIQAYRASNIYVRLYRCEDGSFFYVAEGVQEYLNDLVDISDYALVLLINKLGASTIDEIRHAQKTHTRILFFVQENSLLNKTSPAERVRQIIQSADDNNLLDCVEDDNCFSFSHPSQVCSHLLHALIQHSHIGTPQWVTSADSKRWLSFNGFALMPEDEIINQPYWETIPQSPTRSLPTPGDTKRIFVVTTPDGVGDGDNMLNFVRTLNDVYQVVGIDFEAISFTSSRLGPNATDDTASNSMLFLILGRKDEDSNAGAMLDGAIEAYRQHLDADGDGKPKILTFFEDVVPVPDLIAKMQSHLREIGHYYSVFESIDTVKFMVAIELARLLATNDLFFQKGVLRTKERNARH